MDGHDAEMVSSFYHWPDTVLEKILKFIVFCPDFNQATLLNCRLVSVQWNEMIINTSEIMKKIALPIYNAKEFLNLPIVKSGKVKSIILKDTSPLDLKSKDLKIFVDMLSNVEKVEFAFSSYLDTDSNASSTLIKLILQKCPNLLEFLLIKNIMEGHSAVLCNISNRSQIAACNKINYIAINLNQFIICEFDAAALKSLLFKLPRLRELKMYGWCDGEYMETIFAGLREYIEIRKTGALKKLSLNQKGNWFNTAESEAKFLKLLILCGENDIEIDLDKSSYIALNSLLDAFDICELPENSKSRCPLFPIKLNGLANFHGSSYLKKFDKFRLLNIQKLALVFERPVIRGELNWIASLPILEYLTLTSDSISLPEGKLDTRSVELLQVSLQAGLPSLCTLNIDCIEIFESSSFSLWDLNFPNLNTLNIRDCKITPYDLICELSHLKNLSLLCLENLSNLTDIVFTIDCFGIESFVEDRAPNPQPAMALFKSLKVLELRWLNLLTDACVRNGIAKCKSLETLVIEECENMTSRCIELANCKVEFEGSCD